MLCFNPKQHANRQEALARIWIGHARDNTNHAHPFRLETLGAHCARHAIHVVLLHGQAAQHPQHGLNMSQQGVTSYFMMPSHLHAFFRCKCPSRQLLSRPTASKQLPATSTPLWRTAVSLCLLHEQQGTPVLTPRHPPANTPWHPPASTRHMLYHSPQAELTPAWVWSTRRLPAASA